MRPVARGARGEERSSAISEANGLCRPSEYAATLDTAAALYVRMPEPDFGMSALSGSVEIGADDAADVGRRTPTGTRHARTRIARNAAPEVLVPRKTSGENLGGKPRDLPGQSSAPRSPITGARGLPLRSHQIG